MAAGVGGRGWGIITSSFPPLRHGPSATTAREIWNEKVAALGDTAAVSAEGSKAAKILDASRHGQTLCSADCMRADVLQGCDHDRTPVSKTLARKSPSNPEFGVSDSLADQLATDSADRLETACTLVMIVHLSMTRSGQTIVPCAIGMKVLQAVLPPELANIRYVRFRSMVFRSHNRHPYRTKGE